MIQTEKEAQETLLDKLAAYQREVDDLGTWFGEFKEKNETDQEEAERVLEGEPDVNTIQEQLVENQVR